MSALLDPKLIATVLGLLLVGGFGFYYYRQRRRDSQDLGELKAALKKARAARLAREAQDEKYDDERGLNRMLERARKWLRNDRLD